MTDSQQDVGVEGARVTVYARERRAELRWPLDRGSVLADEKRSAVLWLRAQLEAVDYVLTGKPTFTPRHGASAVLVGSAPIRPMRRGVTIR